MDDLRKYLKYYCLEQYLFVEVSKNVHARGYLTNEEFFAIVIWKSNTQKTKVLKGVTKQRKTIHAITAEVFESKTRENKLKLLDALPSIGIPIASAILSVCSSR